MALAEIPGEWTSAVARWKLLNAPHLLVDGDLRAPSAVFEYMLYQALLGAWQPDDASFAERMQEYALKAAREGKQETSWLNPHAAYEAGVKSFIEKILDPSLSGEFLNALQTLAQRLSLLGALNSLSQITLKAMMPGVPDFYQGTELWDFSLVDPDNRRPVDFAERAGRLDALEKPDWDRLVAGVAERPSEAGLDTAPAQASDRTGRCIHGRRLRTFGSERAAARSFHRVRPAARPRGRDHRGHALVCAVDRRRQTLAWSGELRRRAQRRRLCGGRFCRRRCHTVAAVGSTGASAGRRAEGKVQRRGQAGAKARRA